MTQIYIGYKGNEIDTCIPQPSVLQDKIKLKINFDTSNRKNIISYLIHILKNVGT